jgi:hypothetical protein
MTPEQRYLFDVNGLSTQIIKMMAPAHYTHVKKVVKEDVVRLT